VEDQVITAIGKPLADEARRTDVVMLDHQGAHGPILIWIRMMPFDKLRAH
jgi:hypothetical protein